MQEKCLLWKPLPDKFVYRESIRRKNVTAPAARTRASRCPMFTLKTLLLGVEVVGVAAAAAEDERGAALPLVVVRPLEQLVIAAALVKRLLEALARHGRRRM